MADERTFIIVGASLAGAKAAETLRSEGFTGTVILIGDEDERPYERPPLSKGYLQGTDAKDKVYVHEAGWYAAHDVDLRRRRSCAARTACSPRSSSTTAPSWPPTWPSSGSASAP